jgi:acrylyl-CoA reductase (NADPH)
MRAFIESEIDDVMTYTVRDVEPTSQSPEEILVQVDYSGVNFKDAMVAAAKSRVRRVATLVGGVDAAGTIATSSDPRLAAGTRVAVHGGDLGVARDGGFAQFIYAPASLITPLPETVSTRVAMIVGTAGFTAMQSVLALQDHGLADGAEVLVTGATGGVGSLAVAFLAARGYRPVASTGSEESAEWLSERGATTIIGRGDVSDKPGRVLGSELWDGAVDCVGGTTLVEVLRSMRYGAAVAASGLVASADVATTVYPFITRAVSLIGIDSVRASRADRDRVWAAIGDIAPLIDFDGLVDRITTLETLPDALGDIHNGKTRGRILVDPTPG